MKFGLLDFNLTVNSYWNNSWNKKALLNIGDACEYLVIEQLYHRLGIDESQTIRISIPELITYRGEPIIIAINIAFDSYVGYSKILEEMSPNIIPVFLGVSLTIPELTPAALARLKCFSPVGCRDERTYNYLNSMGVPCYLNGCTASIIQTTSKNIPAIKNKILFIDVPFWVTRYIPEDIKKDIVFLSQEIYCSRDELGESFIPTNWRDDILAYYSSEPKLIVTSRFHGAVLAIAKDIPAMICLEKETYRFSWLHNYFPIYTETSKDIIEWNKIGPVDFSKQRAIIAKIAEKRVLETIDKYSDFLEISELQREKTAASQDKGNQFFYYRRAWKEILGKWNPDKEYTYGFWGVNDNAEMLYSLITKNFPHAKLIDIYDRYREIEFKAVNSKPPESLAEHKEDSNFWLISTAYLASRDVPTVCNNCGFPMSNVILCERDFIIPDDLEHD